METGKALRLWRDLGELDMEAELREHQAQQHELQGLRLVAAVTKPTSRKPAPPADPPDCSQWPGYASTQVRNGYRAAPVP